jgi:Alpha/beta hydrolase domain
MKKHAYRISIAALATSLILLPAQARVTRVEIERSKPAANGYEILHGTFHGEVDPKDSKNAVIVDLEHAPRNATGMVEYSASFQIARPIDPTDANGVLLYDVPNRGNGAAAPDNDGHIRVISGWQGDIPAAANVQWAKVPTAAGVTGAAMARFDSVQGSPKSVAMVGGFGRREPLPLPVSLDTKKAKLLVERSGQKPRLMKAGEWAFADCRETAFPGKADGTQLCLKSGFAPDAAYTLGYVAKDPKVLGLGFAITRDFIAFLRSGKADDAGNANPAGQNIRWTVGAGSSQSGNFLRSFLNLGFNQADDGAQVFDGVHANIAARQIVLNVRFGVPGGGARAYEPGSEGTLWWGRYDDKARKLGTTSLLDSCSATNTCPKIVETLGSAEFWGLRASPNFVGTDAKSDIPLPANVRRYYFPSVTHGGSFVGGFQTKGETSPYSAQGCVLGGNPNPSRESTRVALHALVNWVKADKEPPASRYPTLASGELVAPTAAAMGWPDIPGAPKPDGKLYAFHDYDFGRGYDAKTVSGAPKLQPPRIRRTLPSRVPRVNADGNETSGVPSVQLQVPLGTYTGFNELAAGYGKGGNCVFFGGFIPFAKTKAERDAKGDPRLSLEERYGDHAGFVAKVRQAVAKQQAEGWLLPDDAARLLKEAEAANVLK